MKKSKIIILFFNLFFYLFLTQPQLIFGMGHMSAPINIENAVKGQEYTETLILLNTENVPVKFGLGADGQIKPWTRFYSYEDPEREITEIEMPAKGNLNAYAKISLPADLANGTYRGNINAFTIPENYDTDTKAETIVVQKIPRPVVLIVTGAESKDCKCDIIPRNLRLMPKNPLIFDVWCTNTGNVSIKPLVRLTITQEGNNVADIAYPYPHSKALIPNFLEKWAVEWNTIGLKNGAYDVSVRVFIDDQVFAEDNFRLTIDFNIIKILSASLRNAIDNPSNILAIAGIFTLSVFALICLKKSKKAAIKAT